MLHDSIPNCLSDKVSIALYTDAPTDVKFHSECTILLKFDVHDELNVLFMMANCILDRNVTNIFVFTATCKFLSRISLRKLSGESLLIFRKSEKMCKTNVKLKADLAYLTLYC